jgi:hypothetical protein
VLEALATGLPLTPSRTGEGRRVALVGYLWDRNEADHRANLAELRRLLGALDLELCSLWLAGEPTPKLLGVQRADWIVSLPYGHRAASLLSKRLGCPLLPCELPFGLAATLRFVLTLGAATGRLAAAIAFLEQELSQVLAPLKWIVPFATLHRRIGYVGDPHLLRGLQEIAALVGATVPFAALTNLPAHARAAQSSDTSLLSSLELPGDLRELSGVDSRPAAPDTLLVYPHARELSAALERLGQERALDLLVTNSFGFLTNHMGVVEFGFPSYHSHFLCDRPFLGTRGFLALVERILNASRQFEVRDAHRASAPPSRP